MEARKLAAESYPGALGSNTKQPSVLAKMSQKSRNGNVMGRFQRRFQLEQGPLEHGGWRTSLHGTDPFHDLPLGIPLGISTMLGQPLQWITVVGAAASHALMGLNSLLSHEDLATIAMVLCLTSTDAWLAEARNENCSRANGLCLGYFPHSVTPSLRTYEAPRITPTLDCYWVGAVTNLNPKL